MPTVANVVPPKVRIGGRASHDRENLDDGIDSDPTLTPKSFPASEHPSLLLEDGYIYYNGIHDRYQRETVPRSHCRERQCRENDHLRQGMPRQRSQAAHSWPNGI